MQAEIISVGTELLLGNTINTNTATVGRELAAIGIDVYRTVVVGDNEERLEQALCAALARADVVILTGGLGPTYDDITKGVVCKHFGCEMTVYEPALEKIHTFMKKMKNPPELIEQMAYMPKGAQPLPNDNGSAVGFAITEGERTVAVLPGPPWECELMLTRYLAPYLGKLSGKVFVSRFVDLFGITESEVQTALGSVMQEQNNPTIAPYIKPGEVQLRVTASAKTEEEARALTDPTVNMLSEKFAAYLYATDAKNLESVAIDLLREKGLKLATAESCTGGLIAKRITDIAGSSDVFEYGVCTYANIAKERLLGVSHETLATVGAVSAETAAQMAAGVRKLSGADIGVSVTGIAGPGGGSNEKPVGTVFMGIDSDALTETYRFEFRGDRSIVRELTASNALEIIIEVCKKTEKNIRK